MLRAGSGQDSREVGSSQQEAVPAYRIPLWFYAFIPSRLSGGLIAPLMPLFVVQVLNGNLADVGWVASLTSLASGPASILWGNLSDRMQRRLPFMLAGLASFGLSTILTGLATNIYQVLAYSFAGSLIGTAIGPTSSALLIENIPEKQWPLSFGWFNQIGGLSYVAGMVIGTLWLQFFPASFDNTAVMRGLYLFAGAMAMASPILAAVWIKEPAGAAARRVQPLPAGLRLWLASAISKVDLRPSTLFSKVGHPLAASLAAPLGRYFLYTFLLFFGINIAFMPFPLFLSQALNASNSQVFLINMVKSVVDTFFFVPMGRWMVNHRGIGLQTQAAALRALLFAVCGLLAFLQAGQTGLYVLVVVQILNGITWAAISVSGPTVVATLTRRGTEARAIGAYNAVVGMAGITGNLAAGYLVQYSGYLVSFSTAAVMMALTAGLMWQLRGHGQESSSPEE